MNRCTTSDFLLLGRGRRFNAEEEMGVLDTERPFSRGQRREVTGNSTARKRRLPESKENPQLL